MRFQSILKKIKSFASKFSVGQSGSRNMDNALDVVVFGSSNVDFITYMNKLPNPGETLQAIHREQCFGGKGANQCVAAAKLGAKCALVSKLGNDDMGVEYFHYLNCLGINLDNVELVEDCATGVAQIYVDDNAENTIVVLSGANTFLKATDATKAKKLFKHAKVLLCQLETEEKSVLTALKQFKGISILNAAPAKTDLNIDLIKAPTILCINEVEAAQLTSCEEIKTLQDAKAAANQLVDMGAQSVIITMGAQGAVHLSSKERDVCTHCPAAPVRYLADTSGAGDAFIGSLAYHIARFPNLCRESHINAANTCAAYSVGHRGTQPSFAGPELAQANLCLTEPQFTIITDETKPEQSAAKAEAKVEPEKAVVKAEPEKAEVKAEPEKAEMKAEPEPQPQAQTDLRISTEKGI